MALPGVIYRYVQCRLRDTDTLSRYTRPRKVQGFHGHQESHPLAADPVLLRDPAVLENQFPGGGAPDAHLLFLLTEGETRCAFFNDESGSSPGSLGFIGDGDHRVNSGLAAVGDPLFGAVQYIGVPVFYRRSPDPPGITARVGFGKTESCKLLSGGYLGQIALLLFIRSKEQDRIGTETGSGKTYRYTQASTAELFHRDYALNNTTAESTVLFRNVQTEKARLGTGLYSIPWKLFRLIQFFPDGKHLFLGDLPGDILDSLLLFGKKIVHVLLHCLTGSICK